MPDQPGDWRRFWCEFLARTGRSPDSPVYDVFCFGDSARDAAALASLVVQARKRATASLVWQHEARGRRGPRAGDLSVVCDWSGWPLCVIETVRVAVRPFDEVDEAFAAAEGEGDGSLACWRRAHWAYFGRVCARLGRKPSPAMPVVCERFRLVFSLPEPV